MGGPMYRVERDVVRVLVDFMREGRDDLDVLKADVEPMMATARKEVAMLYRETMVDDVDANGGVGYGGGLEV